MSLARLSLLALLSACAPAAAPDSVAGPSLESPIACVVGSTCEVQHYVDRVAGPGISDYRCGRATYDGHNGVDFRLPDLAAMRAGVSVLAAADGRVARLRDGMDDVSIRAADAPLVAGQECGNGVVIDHGEGWETQYCHLARGSIQVKVGDAVRGKAPLGRVGLSGDTEFPHLHFTVRHDGVVVDPFAPDPYGVECRPKATLWSASAAGALRYRTGAVLNAGFSSQAPEVGNLDAVRPPPATMSGAVLVAYVRVIGLQAGDVQDLVLKGPGGAVLARQQLPALDRDMAQYAMFVGKKRPPEGWPSGSYTASFRLIRNGRAVSERSFSITL